MKTLLAATIALAAVIPATPAAAREPIADADLPDIEAMAPALDHMLGALLDVDVGPLIDAAADPYGRHARRHRERTLGDLARRDDPYFDERMRGAIYTGTAQTGAMMHAMAAMLPALERSLDHMSRQMEEAMSRPYRDRGPDEGWDDRED